MTYRASSRQFGYSDASATRFTADIRSEGLEPSLLDTKVTQRNDTSFTPVDLPSGIFPSEDNPHLHFTPSLTSTSFTRQSRLWFCIFPTSHLNDITTRLSILQTTTPPPATIETGGVMITTSSRTESFTGRNDALIGIRTVYV